MPKFNVRLSDTVEYVVTVTATDAEAAKTYAVENCTEDDTQYFVGVVERQAIFAHEIAEPKT